jgi:hypothetical protein
MAKILKSNGVFVCRSTLRHLTDEELDSSVHKDLRPKFDESTELHLGPATLPQDFPAEDLTPDPTYYDDTDACRRPLIIVPYIRTFVPYIHTFGAPN